AETSEQRLVGRHRRRDDLGAADAERLADVLARHRGGERRLRPEVRLPRLRRRRQLVDHLPRSLQRVRGEHVAAHGDDGERRRRFLLVARHRPHLRLQRLHLRLQRCHVLQQPFLGRRRRRCRPRSDRIRSRGSQGADNDDPPHRSLLSGSHDHSRAPAPQRDGARRGGPRPTLRGVPRACYIMSGIPPGMPAPAFSFSGASATIASVVRMFFAIDAAFCSAERVTIVGSMMPDLTRSSISPESTFRPWPLAALRTLSTTTEPSRPAFVASWRSGSSSARRMIEAPVFSSPSSDSTLFLTESAAFRSATPPPGTMPSSSAARVACSASSTRFFFSFISVSVAAPTFTTATPPASFASRSCSFSRSKSESVFSISCFSCLMRALIASESPAPSMMVVESLSTTTLRARPSCESFVFSSLRPISSVITSPPVRIAMSSSMRLRR